jgi:hypothetical protein
MKIDSRFMLHVLTNEKPDISYLIGEVYRERLASLGLAETAFAVETTAER